MNAETMKLMQSILKDAAAYVSQAWSVAGPLVGVLIGGYLSTNAQSKKWLADNRKEEYRAILTALMFAFEELIKLADGVVEEKDFRRITDAMCVVVNKSLLNVIFIRDELDTRDISQSFHLMLAAYASKHNTVKLFEDFETVRRKVKDKATQTQRLVKFWNWRRP